VVSSPSGARADAAGALRTSNLPSSFLPGLSPGTSVDRFDPPGPAYAAAVTGCPRCDGAKPWRALCRL
jgi:hypothetical protein